MDKLFDIIADAKNRAEIYEKTLKLIDEEKRKAVGVKMAYVYGVITKLQNSENSAGWEDRHVERIVEMNKVSLAICDEFKDFLP